MQKIPKLTPKIILEGTRLTFKTELAFVLNEHPRIVGPRKYRYHSPIISAEWCAFTNFPWGRGLINFNEDEEDMAMETYATWARLFELQRYYSWIIDRFHISTLMFQKIYNHRNYDFTWLEQRLNKLNFRLIYCYRTPESFAAAKTERLKVSGNPSQYNDLNLFIEEQQILNDIIEKSTLPVHKVDMSTNDVPGAANNIAQYLEESGGLAMPI